VRVRRGNPGRRHESSEIDVEEEDQVTLLLTPDRPIEVRVHGYDLEKEVSPDEETDLSFGANLTGRFDIEDHETDRVWQRYSCSRAR
jgi:hypothetical protein